MEPLTDDDMTIIEGKRDQLVGKIQNATVIRRSGRKGVDSWENAMIAAVLIPPADMYKDVHHF